MLMTINILLNQISYRCIEYELYREITKYHQRVSKMGKRKTAKTGDKALYGAREELASQSTGKKKDEDPMYDEVDRFHNDKDEDFIRLGEEAAKSSDDEDEDLAGNTHSVLDLGAGGTSSDEDSDDDDDSSDDEGGRDKN